MIDFQPNVSMKRKQKHLSRLPLRTLAAVKGILLRLTLLKPSPDMAFAHTDGASVLKQYMNVFVLPRATGSSRQALTEISRFLLVDAGDGLFTRESRLLSPFCAGSAALVTLPCIISAIFTVCGPCRELFVSNRSTFRP